MNNISDVSGTTLLPPSQPAFKIKTILSRAWEHANGAKLSFWAIAIFMILISVLVMGISMKFWPVQTGQATPHFRYLLLPLIQAFLIAPFCGGALMVVIKCARGETVTPRTGYQYFHRAGALMITMVVVAFIANLILYLVSLPQLVDILKQYKIPLVFLADVVSFLVYIFTFLSVPLVVDRNYSPLQGIKYSVQLIRHCWFKVAVLLIIGALIVVLALLPAIIGALLHPYAGFLGQLIFLVVLIWLLPFLFSIQGELYHQLVDRSKPGA